MSFIPFIAYSENFFANSKEAKPHLAGDETTYRTLRAQTATQLR